MDQPAATSRYSPVVRIVLASLVGASLLVGALVPRGLAAPAVAPHRGPTCRAVTGRAATAARLDLRLVDRSLALGTSFLLANQKPAGNFHYQYDWHRHADSDQDSAVRQAGAAWGLALLHRSNADPKLAAALERAIGFFARHTRETARGERYLVYPSSAAGSQGAVALVALTLIDTLRAGTKRRPALRRALDGYLRQLVRARLPSGRFHAHYRHHDGAPVGDPSPYFDGESLLALVLAARYLGRSDLRDLALAEAAAGHRLNVELPLRRAADPAITKGYYQWASMAYAELAHSGWPGAARYGDWLLALTDWMVQVHQPLRRRRNTAYAYEGIVPAYALARERGDAERTARLGCVIERGLGRLTSWQVGGPAPGRAIAARPTRDPRAIGGVQNHAREPALRIDVTQHQMHALLLARQLYLRR